MDLFETTPAAQTGAPPPLAARMRPRSLDDVAGQEHVLGAGQLLRRAIQADRLGSLILYGPPGCGKTTLAEVIAAATRRRFVRASGVLSNSAALREHCETARMLRAKNGAETILFVDEIHRFNKAQQDVLLPYVEEGAVTLVGATTHNPFFFINGPLVSRSQIIQLQALAPPAILILLRRALATDELLRAQRVAADDAALEHLAAACDGDARKALNALEIAALSTAPGPDGTVRLDLAAAQDSIQKKAVLYDRDEDGHHDTISAFIKSVRGSDPNAAVYWLAKMIYAGEDPRFIARRLVILASEDIGNADPRGLSVAVAALHAAEFVGMPEARIILGQATTYLATAPKSNAAYLAIDAALADVRAGRTLPVPDHLKSAAYRGAEQLGHQGYRYAHAGPEHFVDQEYAPTDKVYYEPTDQGYEETIRKRLAHWQALREAARAAPGQTPRKS